MKSGLSGNITNEIEVSERWNEMQRQARKNLDRLKQLEKENPKKLIKTDIGLQTEGFTAMAGKIMKKRMKERFERKNEH